jgi:hypothetical protein
MLLFPQGWHQLEYSPPGKLSCCPGTGTLEQKNKLKCPV